MLRCGWLKSAGELQAFPSRGGIIRVFALQFDRRWNSTAWPNRVNVESTQTRPGVAVIKAEPAMCRGSCGGIVCHSGGAVTTMFTVPAIGVAS